MNTKRVIAAVFTLGMAAQVNAAALIDNFNDFDTLTTNVVGGTVSSDTGVGALNGLATNRHVDLTAVGGPGHVTGETIACTGNPGLNCMSYSAETGTTGTMTVIWTLGGVDLTAGGDNALETLLNFGDFSANLDITIMSGAVASVLNGIATPSGVGGAPGVPMLFTYASFSDPNAFLSVDSITFDLTMGTAATDLEFAFLGTTSTVALPAPLALVGLGLVGLVGLSRRKAA